MRVKLDECVDVRLKARFQSYGHDTETVYSEKVSGASDSSIYELCLLEKRALVTQDMDFGNPFRFDPLPTEGIIVLRNPSQGLSELALLVEMTLLHLCVEISAGHLWVVGKQGIRIWPA